MLVGVIFLILIPPNRMQWAFYSFGIVYFLSMCMVFWVSRFAFPVVPMYVALGLSWLVDPQVERPSRLTRVLGDRVSAGLRRLTRRDSLGIRMGITVVIVALLVTQVRGIVVCERFYLEHRPLFILPAAQFLKEHAERAADAEQKTVLARKPHIAYYAGMAYVAYPTHVANSREFVASAVDRGADYIVFSILEYAYRRDADWLVTLDRELGVERILRNKKIMIYDVADWLDLDGPAGRVELERRLTHLRSLERSGSPWELMQASAEIYLLYFYNGELDKAAEHLLKSLEAAGMLSNREEADFYIGKLGDEVTLLAHAYSSSGRRGEGAALVDDAVKRVRVHRGHDIPSGG
jgi:hypothetical protein